MSIFEIIGELIDLVTSWRFYLCLLIGLGLGALILSAIPHQIVAWTLAGAVFLASFVIGWRWDSSRS